MALGEFAVPMFLRFPVYAVESFTQFAAFYRPEAAAAAAAPLALVVLIVLALERALLRERTYEVRFVGSGSLRIPLARWTPALLGVVIAACALTVALPLASLAFRAAAPGAVSSALDAGGAPLVRSVAYALTGATLLTVVGFLLGYTIQRRIIARWRTIDTLTILVFAMPSTVMGVGLVTLWNRPGLEVLYGTAGLVITAYLAQFTGLTSRASVAGLSMIPVSLEEAARLTGAGWLRTTRSIVAPLAGQALGVAWLVAYLFCMRDTGLIMMTYPPGGDTLPVRTFTLMANGSQELIAAMCMIMIAATLLPLTAVGALMAWRRSGSA
jgi:iron(III) transport system permease protein